MEIIDNKLKQRFETRVGEEDAYIDYRWYKGSFALMHTFVPKEGRGKGIAEALAKHVLDHARELDLKIMIYCSYIAKYIKLHPVYEDLKDRRYHP